jgi:transcription initiation factor IIE alpha subunit
MSAEYKDRFTEAEKEQQDKSAFVCETCDTKYSKKEAEEKEKACCDQPLKEIKKQGFGP